MARSKTKHAGAEGWNGTACGIECPDAADELFPWETPKAGPVIVSDAEVTCKRCLQALESDTSVNGRWMWEINRSK